MEEPLKHVSIVFTADLHGMVDQYAALSKAAVTHSALFFSSHISFLHDSTSFLFLFLRS